MINKFRKKQTLMISGFFLIASLCVFVIFSNGTKKITPVKQKEASSYSDKIFGFSPDTKMAVNYINKSKDIYAVQYTLTSGSNSYIDIELQINKHSQKMNTLLSGLPHTAKISLLVGQNPYYKDVPVDWAGRMELASSNIDFWNENDICLKIDGLYQNQRSTLCHNAAQPAIKSGEGQVPS